MGRRQLLLICVVYMLSYLHAYPFCPHSNLKSLQIYHYYFYKWVLGAQKIQKLNPSLPVDFPLFIPSHWLPLEKGAL